MTGTLVLGVAGPEVVAVVGGEQHDRLFGQVQALQRVLQAAVGLVEALHHAVVPAQVPRRRPAEGGQIGRHPAAGVALAVAVRRRVVVEMVLVVRLDVGDEQVERVLSSGALVDVTDRRVGYRIDAVPWQLHGLAVAVVQHGVVRLGGELQNVGRQPVAIAEAFVGRHRPHGLALVEMPLADVGRVVPGLAEVVCQGAAVPGKGNGVAVTARGRGVETGLAGRIAPARRPADR